MSSKSCLLLVMLAALLAPAESFGDELDGPTLSAVLRPIERPAPPPEPAAAITACVGAASPAGLGADLSPAVEAFCFPGADLLDEAVREFNRELAAERERRRLKRARERRERIAKRRAERRAKLLACVRYVAERYTAPGEGKRLFEAPPRVQEVICAANEIDDTIYSYGGGHAEFEPGGDERNGGPGYDCSGAVSYALRGGDMIDAPLASGPLEGWGEPGTGKWITVYTNPEHVWMIVAGVRFDTSEPPPGETGPRWHSYTRSTEGFVARHPSGY